MKKKFENDFKLFNLLLKDFANIFNHKEYNKEFIKYLKSIEIPNTQICSKIDYYVQCKTYKADSSCISLFNLSN